MADLLRRCFKQIVSVAELLKLLSVSCASINGLDNIVFCVPKGATLLPKSVTLQCVFSLEVVIHRAIEHLVRAKSNNVLSVGYESYSESRSGCLISDSINVQMSTFNSLVVMLRTRSWEALYGLIGDDVFYHLLTNCSVFYSVQKTTYIQICGTPVYDIPLFKRKCKFLPHSVTSNKTKSLKRKAPVLESSCKKKLKLGVTLQRWKVTKVNVPPNVFCARREKHSRKRETVWLTRSRMFYSRVLMDGLSNKHISKTMSSSNAGVSKLMKVIFGYKKESKVYAVPKFLLGFKAHVKFFIEAFKNEDLRRCVATYCPLPKWYRESQVYAEPWSDVEYMHKLRYALALKSFVPEEKVILFLRRLLMNLFPEAIWGSSHNKRNILRCLVRFVRLGRYERLSLDYVMRGIKISAFNWPTKCRYLQQSAKRQRAIESLMTWLYNSLIVPLLQAYFYVTETGRHKHKVFYYRKPVWRVLQETGMKMLSLYQSISMKEVRLLNNTQCMGVYDIRLLLNQSKIRPIANINSSWRGDKLNKRVFINYKLRLANLALRYEVERNPSLVGASVSDPTEVFTKWRQFKMNLKSHYSEPPKVYIASVDISRCFDTLPQDKIAELVRGVFTQTSYLFRTFSKVRLAHNGISRKVIKGATSGKSCATFIDYITERVEEGRIAGRDCVFVDRVYTQSVRRAELIDQLTKHVLCSIGRIGNKCYRQVEGIPQGSVVATMLNNLYYGDIERKHFQSFLSSPCSLLMRWVDDYIFVSTSHALAERFVCVMHELMASFNCNINPKKTLLNFHTNLASARLNCIQGDWFPWCGYFINQSTLDFSFNYMQYVGNNLKNGMTVEYCVHPGLAFSRKLVQTTSVKANPLTLDPTLNHPSTVHLNIYQAFRFIALKFYVHTKSTKDARHPDRYLDFNSQLILHQLPLVFVTSARNNYARCRLLRQRNGSNDRFSKLNLDAQLVRFLCYQAFLDCLRVKQTRYKKLIGLIVRHIRSLEDARSRVDLKILREKSRFFSSIKS